MLLGKRHMKNQEEKRKKHRFLLSMHGNKLEYECCNECMMIWKRLLEFIPYMVFTDYISISYIAP